MREVKEEIEEEVVSLSNVRVPATASRIKEVEEPFTFELATPCHQAPAQEITDVPALAVQQPTESLLEKWDELGNIISGTEA